MSLQESCWLRVLSERSPPNSAFLDWPRAAWQFAQAATPERLPFASAPGAVAVPHFQLSGPGYSNTGFYTGTNIGTNTAVAAAAANEATARFDPALRSAPLLESREPRAD